MSEEAKQQEARVFTRADVEQYFLRTFQSLWSNPVQSVQINEIFLLEETFPPTWEVDYTVSTSGTLQYEFRSSILVCQSVKGVAGDHLTTTGRTKLPKGCTTIADEDTAIIQRDKEELRQYMEEMESQEMLKDGKEVSQ